MRLQSWATKGGYQKALLPPRSFHQIVWDPDQSEHLIQIKAQEQDHLSGFHTHNYSVHPNQQIHQQSSIGTENISQASNISASRTSSHITIAPLVGKSIQASTQNTPKKRQDDNNNAHKPFITVLNEVLSDQRLLETLKKDLKKEGGKLQKGSRYSFIMRLIDTRMLLQSREESFRLQSILKIYGHRIAYIFKLPKNPTPADQLKNNLIKHYIQATELFLQQKYDLATQSIYDIEGAKQDKYKKKGILKVNNYLKKKAAK